MAEEEDPGALPPDVLQFASVLFAVTITSTAVLLVFSILIVSRHPRIVAPLDPKGRAGRAKSGLAWVAAVWATTETDVRRRGGVDAEMFVRLIRMRLTMFLVWVPVSVALGLVYAYAPDATLSGFARFSLANIITEESPAIDERSWRLWLAAAGVWAVQAFALRVIDAFDADAPAHHYAVVVTGLPPSTRSVEEITSHFKGAFDGVLRVVLVDKSNFALDALDAEDDVDETPKDALAVLREGTADVFRDASSRLTKGKPHSLGGIRQRVQAFVDALQAAKRADAQLAAAQKREAAQPRDVEADDVELSFVEKEAERVDEATDEDFLDMLRARKALRATQEQMRATQEQMRSSSKKLLKTTKGLTNKSLAGCEKIAVDARLKVEEARQALMRVHAAGAVPASAAAVVVFDTVARATIASTAPLGIPELEPLADGFRDRAGVASPLARGEEKADAFTAKAQAEVRLSVPTSPVSPRRREAAAAPWAVTPCPEPGDIDWQKLEGYEFDAGKRADVLNAGFAFKTVLNITYSILLTAISFGILRVVKLTANVVKPLRVTAALVSGLVPAQVQKFMLAYMATILGQANRACGADLWAASKLQRAVQRDYCAFFAGVGFVAPLIGASFFEALTETTNPVDLIKLMALNVPTLAYTFAMLLLLQIGNVLQNSMNIVPYAMYLFYKAKGDDDDALDVALAPKEINFGQESGWEFFATLCAACYAPIAPLTTCVAAFYLTFVYIMAKHDAASVSKTPFRAGGGMWRLGIAQSHMALAVALALQGGIILLAGGFWQACALTPLAVLWNRSVGKADRRYSTMCVHGVSKGRLPLRDAAKIDSSRPGDAVRDRLCFLVDFAAHFSPPCALPPPGSVWAQNALPGPPLKDGDSAGARLALVQRWVGRQDAPPTHDTPATRAAQRFAPEHQDWSYTASMHDLGTTPAAHLTSTSWLACNRRPDDTVWVTSGNPTRS